MIKYIKESACAVAMKKYNTTYLEFTNSLHQIFKILSSVVDKLQAC